MARHNTWKSCAFALLVAAGCENTNTTPPVPPPPPLSTAAGSPAPVVGERLPDPPTPPPCGTIAALVIDGETPSVLQQDAKQADVAPPPISGGTLLATRDGAMLVASDPDRDQLYFVDAKDLKLSHVRVLTPGDEPGRLVEDAAGRIHVALRGGRALLTLTREPDSIITRRAICDVPRGLAYDASGDVIHVACAEGKLVTIGAAPDAAVQDVRAVERDVRDVIVRGDQLLVSRFRSADLLALAADGGTAERFVAPTLSRMDTEVVADGASDGSSCSLFMTKDVRIDDTPSVAYRTIDVPGKGVVMLHQRAQTGAEIQTTPGGYSNGGTCGAGIVHTSITTGLERDTVSTVDLAGAVVAVDVASDPEGSLLAVVAPGNWGTGTPQLHIIPLGQLPVTPRSSATPSSSEAPASAQPQPQSRMLPSAPLPNGASSVPVMPPPSDTGTCFGSQAMPPVQGQATAVAFVSSYLLAVQQREPAAMLFIDLRTSEVRTTISLDSSSRFDTGHTMFHARTNAGLACASCHAEGGDDAHVWTFSGIGPRRTQSLRGGILGTEPFHWNGDMHDFNQLVHEVLVGRMSGFQPTQPQSDALSHWIDRQPALHAQAADQTAATRGQELFESAAVGCSSCHAGTQLTDNSNRDVGTGAVLQVPSLRGVSFRTPLMHDGCAATLADRFGPCGGGDAHGLTSQLSVAQRSDLIAYLETL